MGLFGPSKTTSTPSGVNSAERAETHEQFKARFKQFKLDLQQTLKSIDLDGAKKGNLFDTLHDLLPTKYSKQSDDCRPYIKRAKELYLKAQEALANGKVDGVDRAKFIKAIVDSRWELNAIHAALLRSIKEYTNPDLDVEAMAKRNIKLQEVQHSKKKDSLLTPNNIALEVNSIRERMLKRAKIEVRFTDLVEKLDAIKKEYDGRFVIGTMVACMVGGRPMKLVLDSYTADSKVIFKSLENEKKAAPMTLEQLKNSIERGKIQVIQDLNEDLHMKFETDASAGETDVNLKKPTVDN